MKRLKTIVAELRDAGFDVEARIRKDGGAIIKAINGVRYTGTSGNAAARALLGESLSPKKAEQLARITTTGKRASNRLPTDEDVQKALRRVQRKWNKAFPHARGESPAVGRVTAKKTRWYMERYGKEETLRMLEERERYAMGKAYSKNISILAEYVREAGTLMGSDELLNLASDIETNGWKIDEDTIQPAYQELYKLNQGVDPAEVARSTRKILKV